MVELFCARIGYSFIYLLNYGGSARRCMVTLRGWNITVPPNGDIEFLHVDVQPSAFAKILFFVDWRELFRRNCTKIQLYFLQAFGTSPKRFGHWPEMFSRFWDTPKANFILQDFGMNPKLFDHVLGWLYSHFGTSRNLILGWTRDYILQDFGLDPKIDERGHFLRWQVPTSIASMTLIALNVLRGHVLRGLAFAGTSSAARGHA